MAGYFELFLSSFFPFHTFFFCYIWREKDRENILYITHKATQQDQTGTNCSLGPTPARYSKGKRYEMEKMTTEIAQNSLPALTGSRLENVEVL